MFLKRYPTVVMLAGCILAGLVVVFFTSGSYMETAYSALTGKTCDRWVNVIIIASDLSWLSMRILLVVASVVLVRGLRSPSARVMLIASIALLICAMVNLLGGVMIMFPMGSSFLDVLTAHAYPIKWFDLEVQSAVEKVAQVALTIGLVGVAWDVKRWMGAKEQGSGMDA